MTDDAGEVIARELEAGETLLWSGRPRTGIVFRGYDFYMVPFSILWGGGVISMETATIYSALKSGSGVPFIFVLFGGVFMLFGLYLLFGRFLVDTRQREHTRYGVTDRRVVIVSGLFDRPLKFNLPTLIAFAIGMGRRRVRSLDLRTMSDISMIERSDGSGVITFGPQMTNAFLAVAWMGWMNNNAGSNFEQIEHVKSVYEVIRAAQRNAR